MPDCHNNHRFHPLGGNPDNQFSVDITCCHSQKSLAQYQKLSHLQHRNFHILLPCWSDSLLLSGYFHRCYNCLTLLSSVLTISLQTIKASFFSFNLIHNAFGIHSPVPHVFPVHYSINPRYQGHICKGYLRENPLDTPYISL